jgi:hypothetical protein
VRRLVSVLVFAWVIGRDDETNVPLLLLMDCACYVIKRATVSISTGLQDKRCSSDRPHGRCPFALNLGSNVGGYRRATRTRRKKFSPRLLQSTGCAGALCAQWLTFVAAAAAVGSPLSLCGSGSYKFTSLRRMPTRRFCSLVFVAPVHFA